MINKFQFLVTSRYCNDYIAFPFLISIPLKELKIGSQQASTEEIRRRNYTIIANSIIVPGIKIRVQSSCNIYPTIDNQNDENINSDVPNENQHIMITSNKYMTKLNLFSILYTPELHTTIVFLFLLLFSHI